MDTDVHIRHGIAWKIRRLRWLVSDQDMPKSILGRPILDALGLDTKGILAADADKYAGTIDANQFTMNMSQLGT